jgi:hypothetical protein
VPAKFGGALSRMMVVGDRAGSQSAGASFAVTSGAHGKDHAPPPGQHLPFMTFVEAACCDALPGQFIIPPIVRAAANKLLRAIGIVETGKFLLGRRGPPIGLVAHTLTPPTALFRPKRRVTTGRDSERSPQTFVQLCGAGQNTCMNRQVFLRNFQEFTIASAAPAGAGSRCSTSTMRGQDGCHTRSLPALVPCQDQGRR